MAFRRKGMKCTLKKATFTSLPVERRKDGKTEPSHKEETHGGLPPKREKGENTRGLVFGKVDTCCSLRRRPHRTGERYPSQPRSQEGEGKQYTRFGRQEKGKGDGPVTNVKRVNIVQGTSPGSMRRSKRRRRRIPPKATRVKKKKEVATATFPRRKKRKYENRYIYLSRQRMTGRRTRAMSVEHGRRGR